MFSALGGLLNCIAGSVFDYYLCCETIRDTSPQSAVDVEELQLSDVENTEQCVTPKRLKKSGDSACYSGRVRVAHIKLAERALSSVRRVWSRSRDMLENGFCHKLFVPELLVLNAGMIKLALGSLGVSNKVIGQEDITPDDRFMEFMYCLKQQRRVLDISNREEYDQCWGFDSDGHLMSKASCSSARKSFLWQASRVDALLKAEFVVVSSIAEDKGVQLSSLESSHREPSSVTVGVHLLHIFIGDVLGHSSAASNAFRWKAKQM